MVITRRTLIFVILLFLIFLETAYIGRNLFLRYSYKTHATPEQRGFELAEKLGCFTCHGPGGTQAIELQVANVPPWDGQTYMMYVSNEEEIRNWILYGNRTGPTSDSSEKHEDAFMTMPAYKGLITEKELEDLVAFYKAVAWFRQPEEESVQRGRELAQEYGCFNCHGPEGRLNLPNPGSFKGYIPAWTGTDYEELVQNDSELREWILKGISSRFKKNPAATFFLKRQKIKMPAYENVLSEEELEDIIQFIEWVRQTQ